MSRWVSVGPERLAGWLERVAAGHGGASADPDPARFTGLAGVGRQP